MTAQCYCVSLTGNEFQNVGAAIEKALVPMFVSNLGTGTRSELDDRRCLGCLARVNGECKCAGC